MFTKLLWKYGYYKVGMQRYIGRQSVSNAVFTKHNLNPSDCIFTAECWPMVQLAFL